MKTFVEQPPSIHNNASLATRAREREWSDMVLTDHLHSTLSDIYLLSSGIKERILFNTHTFYPEVEHSTRGRREDTLEVESREVGFER